MKTEVVLVRLRAFSIAPNMPINANRDRHRLRFRWGIVRLLLKDFRLVADGELEHVQRLAMGRFGPQRDGGPPVGPFRRLHFDLLNAAEVHPFYGNLCRLPGANAERKSSRQVREHAHM